MHLIKDELLSLKEMVCCNVCLHNRLAGFVLELNAALSVAGPEAPEGGLSEAVVWPLPL